MSSEICGLKVWTAFRLRWTAATRDSIVGRAGLGHHSKKKAKNSLSMLATLLAIQPSEEDINLRSDEFGGL